MAHGVVVVVVVVLVLLLLLLLGAEKMWMDGPGARPLR